MTTTANEMRELPAWYAEYRTSFLAAEAHAFIVHGDIYGLAHTTLSHRRLLIAELAKTRSVIVSYDVAQGITFPDPAMREEAIKLLGIQPQSDEEPDEAFQMMTSVLESLGGEKVEESKGDPFAVSKPLDALRLIEQLLRTLDGKKQVAAIIDYADAIAPPTNKEMMVPDSMTILVMLQSWARDPSLAITDNPFFLFTRSIEDIHRDLRRSSGGYKALEIALPTIEQRQAYITWYLRERENKTDSEGNSKAIALIDLDREQLARLTAGLNLRHIEDVLLLGAKAEGVTRTVVKARKDAIIATEYSEVAEMLEPIPHGFSAIGGMEKLKSWATTEIIDPIRDGRLDDVVRSALLAGPPGSGKTHFISALAWEVGFNAVSLNMENILGSFVGESERKLREFFGLAKAIAPVMIFLDELDQSDVSKRGNGSGNPVAANLFSAMLRFAGDESLRGKVMFFFASNRPDLIDPALLRRMDAVIPVLLPNENGRYGIVLAQARSQGIDIAKEAAEQIAQNSEKYNGSDLASVVRKARKLARRDGDGPITLAQATRALQAIQPSSPELADWFSLIAIKACNDRDLLPDDQASLKDNPEKLTKRIKDATPIKQEGMREERSA